MCVRVGMHACMHAYMRVIDVWLHAYASTRLCSGTGAFETGWPEMRLNFNSDQGLCCRCSAMLARVCVHACMHAWTFGHACLHPCLCTCALRAPPLLFRFVISMSRCFRRSFPVPGRRWHGSRTPMTCYGGVHACMHPCIGTHACMTCVCTRVRANAPGICVFVPSPVGVRAIRACRLNLWSAPEKQPKTYLYLAKPVSKPKGRPIWA